MKNLLLSLCLMITPIFLLAQCDDGTNEMILQVNMYEYGDATEWYITASDGTVVASGPIPFSYDCNGYCGDLYCGFEPGECYSVSSNGDGWSGNVYIQMPNPGYCSTCTMDYAYISGGSDDEFCMLDECDGIQDYVQSYGWGGEDDVAWPITNLVTGDELSSGGISENSGSNYNDWMCFEDGVYEISVCDNQDSYNDWYIDLDMSFPGGNDWYYDVDVYINQNDLETVYGADGYGCYTEYFAVNSSIGCMDPAGIDYSPYNDYQIEECLYPCSSNESFMIIDMNPWSDWQLDGSQTWELTTASGEVLYSGVVENDNDNGCSPYCGTVYCVPTDECVTLTTSGGSWDGYINMSEPSSNCSTCTDWLGDVYSDSSAEVCLSGSACGDGEESISRYGFISFFFIKDQIILVISSPSSSTIGFFTLILAIKIN